MRTVSAARSTESASLCALRAFAASSHVHADAAEPRVLVDGYELELVAREPDIVTPIGMAFDSQGRLLVIESHTHQRPDDYAGPAGRSHSHARRLATATVGSTAGARLPKGFSRR